MSNFSEAFTVYLRETGIIALFIAVLGSALLIPTFMNNVEVAERFYGPGRTAEPPSYRATNITIVPMSLLNERYQQYFMDVEPKFSTVFWVIQALFCLSNTLSTFYLSVLFANLNGRILAVCIFVYLTFFGIFNYTNYTEYNLLASSDENENDKGFTYILTNVTLLLTFYIWAYYLPFSLSPIEAIRKNKWWTTWALFKVRDSHK